MTGAMIGYQSYTTEPDPFLASPSNDEPSSDEGPGILMIIGYAVGGLILLLALIGLIFRKCRNNGETEEAEGIAYGDSGNNDQLYQPEP